MLVFLTVFVSCSPQGDRHKKRKANEEKLINFAVFKIFLEQVDEYKKLVKTLKAEKEIYREMQQLSYEVNRIHNKIVERQELGLSALTELKEKVEELEFIIIEAEHPVAKDVVGKLDAIWWDLDALEALINGEESEEAEEEWEDDHYVEELWFCDLDCYTEEDLELIDEESEIEFQEGEETEDTETPEQTPANEEAELTETPEQTPANEEAELTETPEQTPANEEAELTETPEQTPANEEAELTETPEQTPANEEAELPKQAPANEDAELPEQTPVNESATNTNEESTQKLEVEVTSFQQTAVETTGTSVETKTGVHVSATVETE